MSDGFFMIFKPCLIDMVIFFKSFIAVLPGRKTFFFANCRMKKNIENHILRLQPASLLMDVTYLSLLGAFHKII